MGQGRLGCVRWGYEMSVRARCWDAWLVFVGGSIGTLLRYLVGSGFSVLGVARGAHFPLGPHFALDTLTVNLAGALFLGLAVGFVTARGAPTERQTRFRLLFGTGAMGGFTTYSTFALQTSEMLTSGEWRTAAAYALATLIIGGILSAVGLLLGRRLSGLPRRVEGQ